jgi:hypothetical protein
MMKTVKAILDQVFLRCPDCGGSLSVPRSSVDGAQTGRLPCPNDACISHASPRIIEGLRFPKIKFFTKDWQDIDLALLLSSLTAFIGSLALESIWLASLGIVVLCLVFLRGQLSAHSLHRMLSSLRRQRTPDELPVTVEVPTNAYILRRRLR